MSNTNANKTKGLLLFSGGLDSMLAAKVLMEQDIILQGIHFSLPFNDTDYNSDETIIELAKSINLPLRIEYPYDDYIEMLKKPAHGYGKNMNPCIDCKILFLRKASEILHKENYDFIATGEVNGQRPMSQRKDMINHIEKQSDLSGYILRPLSASFFKPTIAEQSGKIDRNLLLNISGRGRHKQLELVEKYDIKDYQSPAGGCLFTDPNYSKRLKCLFEFKKNISNKDLFLLSKGRHFLFPNNIHVIVARNYEECTVLEKYRFYADYYSEPNFSGPNALVFGNLDSDKYEIISSLISAYSKNPEGNIAIYSADKKVIELNSSNKEQKENFKDYRI